MLYRAGTQIAELREIGFPTEKAMQKFGIEISHKDKDKKGA